MRHYLVVANQTLTLPPLAETISSCVRAGPCDFYLLVPATVLHDPVQWTPAEAIALARRRLDAALTRFGKLGADVRGEVGAPSALMAIGEVVRRRSFDELILSTLAAGPSRWLRAGMPQRIEQLFGVPVTLVTPFHEPTAQGRLLSTTQFSRYRQTEWEA